MRILLIEDEVDLAMVLRRGLTAEGYAVDVVHDGMDGVLQAKAVDYAVIILDLMLPTMNGYRVCAHLRAENVQTPILVLTAKTGDDDQAEALDAGADDFLAKPFAYLVLVARLRALLRRPRVLGSATLKVGDLVLDRLSHTCRRDEVTIPLSPREFTIAAILASRPGEPISKDELLQLAWPDDAVDPNLVEVRISSLRRKVDLPFNRNSLQTVRGIGYRLVDDQGRNA